jgi:hypothetical protein
LAFGKIQRIVVLEVVFNSYPNRKGGPGNGLAFFISRCNIFVIAMPLARHALIQFIFFGNFFYGLCSIALAVEAAVQQKYPLNSWSFYGLLFTATVLYYMYAYLVSNPHDATSERIRWYYSRKKFMVLFQILLILLALVCLINMTINCWKSLATVNTVQIVLLLVFPLTAALYYGIDHGVLKNINLRQQGQLKPFIIGFAWAGPVTLYPVLFYCLENNIPFALTLVSGLLFLKNFMFISMLSIMFDIKDYAHDHRQRLGTFVMRAGLRRTIFSILVPLSLLGLGTFITYGLTRDFSAMKIAFNVLPFLLLMLVAWSLARRRSILYYLVVVDGLMVIKAVCGTVAMMFF